MGIAKSNAFKHCVPWIFLSFKEELKLTYILKSYKFTGAIDQISLSIYILNLAEAIFSQIKNLPNVPQIKDIDVDFFYILFLNVSNRFCPSITPVIV